MGFVLFLLVTAIMIIRPADFVPGLEGVPLYQIAIIPCIILSWNKLVPQLTMTGVHGCPVLAFGIGILLISIVSNLAHGQFTTAFDFATEYLKILIFYLLLLANIDSPTRLKRFLGLLAGIILIPISLAVLNFHGYIEIVAFRVISELDGIRRLCGTGIFSDPNDVCEILNFAIILCLCGFLDRGRGLTRVVWLAPMALFGHALGLTQSRGGLLGALVGLAVLFRNRFKGMKSLVAAGAAVALVLLVFAGRQTSLSTNEDSSQSRIQIWDDGMQLFRASPLIGVGTDQYSRNVGHVAHNAFIQTTTELGFLAGAFLFGQYFWCLKNMTKLGSENVVIPEPQMNRLQPFLLASLAGFATSEMTLTNPFGILTYAMFGLATACVRLAEPTPPLPDLVFSGSLIRRIMLYFGMFLAALYAFIKLTVAYG